LHPATECQPRGLRQVHARAVFATRFPRIRERAFFLATAGRADENDLRNVTGWPTIYIPDHKGIIRYRGLRDEAMEQAVVELLEEMKR
jgi:hypothetical protein